MSGPLTGVRVLEIASAAPAPFACMMLADLGADVVTVDRPAKPGRTPRRPNDPLVRSRRSVVADLKNPAGVATVRRLAANADVLVEGFRPGVMERLGLGPDDLAVVNPGLIFARMTGYGQEGPLSARAGHDINYIAVAGALEPIGRAGERPLPPLNLIGDFGGGGMLLAVGILAALHERSTSGRGQVVDAAMVDGAALLTSFVHGVRADGHWSDERGTNLLDGGAPFYDTYLTADGRYMAVGALERRFYQQLLTGLDLDDDPGLPGQMDRDGWPELRSRFAAAFATRTRREWTEIFADLDACVSPVLAPGEAPDGEHAVARTGFIDVGGVRQPAPAPRFSRTPAATPSAPRLPGEDTEQVLADWDAGGLAGGILTENEVAAP
ncbi:MULTISPECIES: CaiB/BaiF CoA transferase family protein [Gordonia]|jgi:alpha-methylacyl-CoA racemase|uniref:Alpha-methylacyl-CoA racemase n=1 Tax=Gordonia alkanivorans NBRC 16433 TaxID=1027371 RepID=F9VPL9_9ACTN|nr:MULTISPECIES: CaiB/BaiF CoA-transferase family protein [Gordonia]MDH3008431.1 CaiB/BaiF CoA-transferase family protein [Gordonia alkanivorans]MDH3015639.1 CaiB/BaiF CoA-transferase family protein [Gordonia alkanivorans]MDH3020373.1 CaiB/BaiF CoA-transferase family protein [Gordonia alkanivorans]MDH3026655.1 CaiB/BaiF CoA-transferase family protein [Gordonia alkanivorans]MDH3040213.1 CaiB/BaiF CoA-transferase family protein [Gordonia alkanivorans]